MSLAMLVSLAVPAFAEDPDFTVNEARMDFYFFDTENVVPQSVYFINGSDVPYFALSDWPAMVNLVYPDENVPELVFSMTENTGVLTREDGYFVHIRL